MILLNKTTINLLVLFILAIVLLNGFVRSDVSQQMITNNNVQEEEVNGELIRKVSGEIIKRLDKQDFDKQIALGQAVEKNADRALYGLVMVTGLSSVLSGFFAVILVVAGILVFRSIKK